MVMVILFGVMQKQKTNWNLFFGVWFDTTGGTWSSSKIPQFFDPSMMTSLPFDSILPLLGIIWSSTISLHQKQTKKTGKRYLLPRLCTPKKYHGKSMIPTRFIWFNYHIIKH
jgi:hypothetical protein